MREILVWCHNFFLVFIIEIRAVALISINYKIVLRFSGLVVHRESF